jgi:hypothetical protein
VLLVYTLDTTFVVEDKAAPLSVVSLGLFPNHLARVVCTASAVLMDTRNGYVYGVAEGTARRTSCQRVDERVGRRRTPAGGPERWRSEPRRRAGERPWDGVWRSHGRPQVAAPYA